MASLANLKQLLFITKPLLLSRAPWCVKIRLRFFDFNFFFFRTAVVYVCIVYNKFMYVCLIGPAFIPPSFRVQSVKQYTNVLFYVLSWLFYGLCCRYDGLEIDRLNYEDILMKESSERLN